MFVTFRTLHRQHQISFWEAMLILAAQHGSQWGAVTILNPFR